jgi:hypothetical protein
VSTILGIVASSRPPSQVTEGNPLGLTPAQLAGLATVVAVTTQVGRYTQAIAGILKAPAQAAEPAKRAAGATSSATITLPATITASGD